MLFPVHRVHTLVVVAPSTALVLVAEANPAKICTESALHFAAAVHPLDAMATFRALFVSPALQQRPCLRIDSKLLNRTTAASMCNLPSFNADTRCTASTAKALRRWHSHSRIRPFALCIHA